MVKMKLLDIMENIGKSVVFFVFLTAASLGVLPQIASAQFYRSPQANLRRLASNAYSTGSIAAALYDPAPTPYCNIVLNSASEYSNLESQVNTANPAATTLAQFVLEAFAEANSNNSLLDSQSATDAVTALTDLQSMWIPVCPKFQDLLRRLNGHQHEYARVRNRAIDPNTISFSKAFGSIRTG